MAKNQESEKTKQLKKELRIARLKFAGIVAANALTIYILWLLIQELLSRV